MKKSIILLGLLSIGYVYAQTGRDHSQHSSAEKRMGINTEKPAATLEVSKATGIPAGQVQGFLLPHLNTTERDAMEKAALVRGLMIFNTTKNCIDWWDGTQWKCMGGEIAGTNTTPTPPPSGSSKPNYPAGLTVTEGRHLIASIYDTDYLPFNKPTTTAVWTTVAADGQPEDKVLDVQGVIPASGMIVQIPITATTSATLDAFTSHPVSIDPQGEEGVASSRRQVILSWEQQGISTGTKYIRATIRPADGRELRVKKLDLNGGIGNDHKGVPLASFSLPKTNGSTENVRYDVRILSGIPDRNYDKETIVNGQNYGTLHRFIYMPIAPVESKGQLWLSMNLGADFANINHPHFDPTILTTGITLHGHSGTMGSIFQWGRPADGHELWTPVNRSRTELAVPTIPGIRWYKTEELTTFTENCPVGWHTPTAAELHEYHIQLYAGSDTYRLPMPQRYEWDMSGHYATGSKSFYNIGQAYRRYDNGGFYTWESQGHVWLRDYSNNYSWLGYETATGVKMNTANPAHGSAIRCLMD